MTLLYHDTYPKPTAVIKVPGGMRTPAEMFWDEQRSLTEKRECSEVLVILTEEERKADVY